MSTRFPAGALVCCGLEANLDEQDWRRLADARLAGHVIFRRNIPTADALAALNAELHALASDLLPPILAIDEEGGVVSRLRHLGFDPPAALAVGAGEVVDRAREVCAGIGQALAALGLNTVFAPCLDVLAEPLNPVIGTRAYGDDPALVARFGRAALAGFQTAGIATVIKHFPGHGGTTSDSHIAEPVVRRGFEDLEAGELVPFAQGIAAGASGVMTAHVRYPDATPAAESALPATQSRFWLDDVLRRRLAFEGPILSDALEMTGAGAKQSFEERIERSIAAGVDLLVCDELAHGLQACAHLERLAADNRWQGRLWDALARVTGLRRRLVKRKPATSAEIAEALAGAHDAFYRAQRAAIACLPGARYRLPIPPAQPLFVALPHGLDAERMVDRTWFAGQLESHPSPVHIVTFDPGPAAPVRLAAEWAGFAAALCPGDATAPAVLLSSLGRGDPGWIREAARLFGDGPGTRIGVALDRPAEVLEMPAAWVRLITYGFGRNALAALVEVVTGKGSAQGKALGLGTMVSAEDRRA